MQVNEKIIKLRESSGKTQREVAELAGISISNYNEVEKGVSKCPLNTLEKICKAHNITLAEFFADDTERIALEKEYAVILKDSGVTPERLKKALKLIDLIEQNPD